MKPLEKEIEDMLMAIGGQEALDVFKLLNGKKDVSEFVLAEKLKLTINQIRTILYKFEKYNLITSIRKKDNTKGWYVYYFTFEEGKAFDAIKQYKVRELEKLKLQLDRESTHQFFSCAKKCTRLTFEAAMEHQFQCLECGQIMNPEDNSKIIHKMKNDIEAMKKDIIEMEALRPKPVIEEEPKKKAVKKKVKKVVKKKIIKKKIVKKVSKKKPAVKKSKPVKKKKR